MPTYSAMRFFPLLILMLCVLCRCSGSGDAPAVPELNDSINPRLAALLADDDTSWMVYAVKPPEAPDGGCARLRTRGCGGPIGKVFADLNPAHLGYARAAGCRPIEDDASAWANGRGLVRVRSSRYFFVDSLSHSYPYLMPHAAQLLEDICRRFADSLQARGGGAYRPKVTSILRTPMTVGRLRRVNRNATQESAHQYGTTFDISYSKFICDDPSATLRTFEDLKNLLAEVIADLRAEGRCMVKHERRQACFHITAAPPLPNSSHQCSE